MRGLRLKFKDNKIEIDFNSPLETVFDCLTQNAVVNVATPKGSDKVFTTKGTDFFNTAVSGGIFNATSASHAANFAAYESKVFINSTLPLDQTEILESFILEVQEITGNGEMILKARAKSSEDSESTITWNLQ